MRKLKNPENYSPAKEFAAWLRQVADEHENRGDYVNCHIQLWYAFPSEVKAAMEKKFGKKDE